MNPTPEQTAIIESTSRETDPSLIVNAVAGSGKTSTLVQAIHSVRQTNSVLCLAFNTRIKDELSSRMPSYASCKTTHSLGFAAWRNHMSMTGRNAELDKKKGWALLDLVGLGKQKTGDLLRLVSLAKASGILPQDSSSEGLVPDILESWQDLIDANNLDIPLDSPISKARDILSASIKLAKIKGKIDFDDMIYMPAFFASRDKFPIHDLVLIDEAQDLAATQHLLIQKLTPPRILAVGDRNQAIYGFRGADYGSMDALQTFFSCSPFPMNLSFRCPRAVVAEAQRYVPHIQSALDIEGIVGAKETWGAKDLKPGDTILCRNNAPLIPICLQLIRAKVNARIIGADIGQALQTIVKNAKGSTIKQILEDIYEKLTKKSVELENKGKESSADRIIDQRDTLVFLGEECGLGAPADALRRLITTIFSDGVAPISLSTIHKAKGLEWERVWFLDSHLIPSRWARNQSQLQQEHNLLYVGITRARRELYYVDSKTFSG